MSALSKAKSHWAAQQNQTLEVPEWGETGKPLVVHFSPLSLAEASTITNLDENVGRARILKYHCKDEQGAPLFGESEAELIKACACELDPLVTARILRAVVGNRVGEAEIDDAKKPLSEIQG